MVERAEACYAFLVPGDKPVRDMDTMVDRFLQWRLPDTFAPDAGISFTPSTHPHGWPVGTNLFDAAQAKAMLQHVLED